MPLHSDSAGCAYVRQTHWRLDASELIGLILVTAFTQVSMAITVTVRCDLALMPAH
jgi:hypothetical protein